MKRNPLSPFAEAISCAMLGLRDGFSPRLILFSVGLWFGSLFLWILIVSLAWAQVKAVAGFFCAWALLGLFVIFPNLLPAVARDKLAGVPLQVGAEALLGRFFGFATGIVLVFMIFVLIVVTVRVALEFGLMPLVRRKVLGHYPALPPHPPSSFLAPVKNVAKMVSLIVLVGLPCLLIPVVNFVLLFVLFGYLNIRSLVNEALDGLASAEEQRSVIRGARWRMVLLGSLLGAAQTIPIVGFLSPAWVCAGTCHLCLRELLRRRETEQEAWPPIRLAQ